jgi:hypothetical protein
MDNLVSLWRSKDKTSATIFNKKMPTSALYAVIMAIFYTIKEWVSKPCKSCKRKLINKDCFNSECVNYFGGTKLKNESKN